MNAEAWSRVKDVFHAALERAPAERSAYLTDACRGDAALRMEVDRLLSAHEQAGSFIEQSPPAAASMTGRVFGRYEVGRLIGSGGMGDVYTARDTELGRAVALKIARGSDADAHLQLRREAQHASQLNHPHVCTIHEVGTADGQPFIVMEYVAGQRLSDLIPKDGLPPDAVVRYGVHIADALAHAHLHGVLHRDLKTANVVVTPEGRAKVLDFGLAQRRSSETSDAQMAGTLSCMAPELLRGGSFDERSDIWGLGVLLYEMAAGGPPFTGGTGFEVSAAILEKPPAPMPSRVPAVLQAIILRCLAKEPRERYQQAVDVRLALDGALGATPAPILLRRTRPRLAVAAVVFVLLAGAVIWRVVRPPSAPVPVSTSGRPAIAVMPFERVGGTQEETSAWMSNGVSSMLMTGLAQTRGLDVVSAERLHDSLKRQGGTNLAALDKSQAAEVARQAGAGIAVFGNIFLTGSEIRVDAQVDDLASGRILVAQSVHGTDMFVLVDQLASQIRDGIGLHDKQDIRGIADVSTSSLEAYRLYSLAMDAYSNSRIDDAQKHLEAAVVIDPGFADAYQQLASVMAFRGLRGPRREYLRKAAEHVDRLSERRRLMLRVQLARDAGDAAEAERAIDELIAKFPDVEQGYSMASLALAPRPGRNGNIQKLMRILSTAAAALPNSRIVRNVYGYALADADRYDEAIQQFQAYVQLAPREPNPYDSLGEGYLGAGYAAKAVESYARALTIDPTFEGGHDGHTLSLAVLGRYDEAGVEEPRQRSLRAFVFSRVGRHREAATEIAAGVAQMARNEDPSERAWLLLESSVLAIERREFARALQDITLAEQSVTAITPPQVETRAHARLIGLLRAVAQIGLRRLDAARVELRSQSQLGEPLHEAEKWWSKALQAEVALASGDLDKASAAFSAGEPQGRMWFTVRQGTVSLLANNLPSRDGPARVAKARGDFAGAIQIYRRLLTDGPDRKWVAAFEPRYVLEIARLLERTGDKQAARAEYARFLEFWKGADADLPEPGEARRAISRLR